MATLTRIIDHCPLQALNLLTPVGNVDTSALFEHIAKQKDEDKLTLKVVRLSLQRHPFPQPDAVPSYIKEIKKSARWPKVAFHVWTYSSCDEVHF